MSVIAAACYFNVYKLIGWGTQQKFSSSKSSAETVEQSVENVQI